MRIDQNDLEPVSKSLLYLQVERRIEELLVRGRYRVGERIPPEAQLVRGLDVSRATVRAAVTRLVEKGLLERRQGSGTFLVRSLEGGRLRKGAERLESYTVQAQRSGLQLDSREFHIETAGAGSEEAAALELAEGSPLARISRILLVSGEPAAWMVDVVPAEILTAERARERLEPDIMVLDLLVSEGVAVGYSELGIGAELVSRQDFVGGALGIGDPTAALSLTETMYLTDGRPIQWSHNIFLPGKLDLHVVRELSEVRKLPNSHKEEESPLQA